MVTPTQRKNQIAKLRRQIENFESRIESIKAGRRKGGPRGIRRNRNFIAGRRAAIAALEKGASIQSAEQMRLLTTASLERKRQRRLTPGSSVVRVEVTKTTDKLKPTTQVVVKRKQILSSPERAINISPTVQKEFRQNKARRLIEVSANTNKDQQLINKFSLGQSVTQKEIQEFEKIVKEKDKALTDKQLQLLKNAPKDVAAGVFEVGRDTAFLARDTVTGTYNYGKRIVSRVIAGENTPVKNDIKKLATGSFDAGKFVGENPRRAAAIVGAAAAQTGKNTLEEFFKNPVKTTTKAAVILFGDKGIRGAIKGAKKVGKATAKTTSKITKPKPKPKSKPKIVPKKPKKPTKLDIAKTGKPKKPKKTISEPTRTTEPVRVVSVKRKKTTVSKKKTSKRVPSTKKPTTIDIAEAGRPKKTTTKPSIKKTSTAKPKKAVKEIDIRKLKATDIKTGAPPTPRRLPTKKPVKTIDISRLKSGDIQFTTRSGVKVKNKPLTKKEIKEAFVRKSGGGLKKSKKAQVQIQRHINKELSKVKEIKQKVVKLPKPEARVLSKALDISKKNLKNLLEFVIDNFRIISGAAVVSSVIRQGITEANSISSAVNNSGDIVRANDVDSIPDTKKLPDTKTVPESGVARKPVQKKTPARARVPKKATDTKRALITRSKTITKPKKSLQKITLPKISWDFKKKDNTVYTFDIVFRERRAVSKNFNKKSNPVVTKTKKVSTTRNRAINMASQLADYKTIRSIDVKLRGKTNKKLKEVSLTNRVNKFTPRRTTNALKFVEKAKFAIDSKQEKRELSSAKRVANVKSVTKKKKSSQNRSKASKKRKKK